MSTTATVTVTVKMFAMARQLAGHPEITLSLPAEATIADLRRGLAERYPELAALLTKSLLAVGNDYARDDRVLQADDDIALIPPVSGG